VSISGYKIMIKQSINSGLETASPAVDTQGAQGATEGSTAGEAARFSERMASEVLEKAARRRFTADYKQRILTEADACTEAGEIGKLLRREGLYSSHLAKWRAQREEAILEGLSKTRGRKAIEKNPLAEEIARLQKENQRLQTHLFQAQTIIDVQKKLSQLLGLNVMTINEVSMS
jgi:transposase-like protein